MSWCPITLLVCLIAVEAVRYSDYSGARMPQYSNEYENKDPELLSEEYSDRSPNAAASFEYKYEEEPRGKMDSPDQEDSWQKPSKRRKRPLKIKDDRIELDENEQDIIPKYKLNHRSNNNKHRLYIKENKRIRNEDVEDVNSKNDYNVNKGRSRGDNSIDVENIDFRDTTRRAPRRKPRDRTMSRERLENNDMRDDRPDFNEKDGDEDAVEIEYEKERRLKTTVERPRAPFLSLNKVKHKNYQEYDEYYDMKRVNNIKNKLPGLFRQTKVSTSVTVSPSMRRFQDITYRRANRPDKPIGNEILTEASSTEKISVPSPVVLITRTAIVSAQPISIISTELSLAEKSRLSILKKAQRKESLGNVTTTTKPPVLMQVTKRMQTLVMVEPPKQDFDFRARAVFDDSPERIARAKNLMRRKLVAGARSIQDLVDNWDEMVCDYIDVSLLDSGGVQRTPTYIIIILLSVINCLLIKRIV